MPRPRKPVSEKQLTANRANAAKSTGPRTPQGKARSSQNARKHGFTASTFAVVRLEDLDPSGNPVIFMAPELSGNGDIEITRAQNRNHALGEGFHRLVQQSNSWSLALRYQAQAERHYRRAVEEFDRLKALRPELPNEPVLDAQPKPKETTCTSEDEPISSERPSADDGRFRAANVRERFHVNPAIASSESGTTLTGCRKGDDTSEIRQTRSWGPERCLCRSRVGGP